MVLLQENELSEDECCRIDYPILDGEMVLFNHFFPQGASAALFTKIKQETLWRQDTISLYGKQHLIPRLTAWYGESDKPYTYSGIAMDPQPFTDTLLDIKNQVEQACNAVFTSVLLNYYRTGQDSMGWHRDNEKELGTNPIIASLSFGQTRPFHVRHKFRKDVPKLVVPLSSGSLLLMKGAMQHFWEHQVPKSAKPLKPRINLTFRKIF